MQVARRAIKISVITLLLCGATGQTFAMDDTTITLGAKVWNNKWTTWNYYPPAGGIPGTTENFTSPTRSPWIPSLTVRYKDFLVTGSWFSKETYGFKDDFGTRFEGKRDETDLHAGYYVLPTLAVTLGYKSVKQDFGPGLTFKYSGPIIGAVGSAPLTRGFSLYGNFGYGPFKANFPSGMVDFNGRGTLDADYYLGEVGIAYSFDIKSVIPTAKAMTATLGYRNQTIAVKDFAAEIGPAVPGQSRPTELRDNTEGLALGLSISF